MFDLQAVKDGFSAGRRTIKPLVQAGWIAEGAAAFQVRTATCYELLAQLPVRTALTNTGFERLRNTGVKDTVLCSLSVLCKQVRTPRGPAVTITCTVTPEGERRTSDACWTGASHGALSMKLHAACQRLTTSVISGPEQCVLSLPLTLGC